MSFFVDKKTLPKFALLKISSATLGVFWASELLANTSVVCALSIALFTACCPLKI